MDGKKISLVLTIILAALFGFMGFAKTLGGGAADSAAMFGYSAGFMMLIGGLELAGAVGLLLRQTRKLASLGLVGLMLGAVVTHIRMPETLGGIWLPLVTLVLLALLLRSQGGGEAEEVAAV